MNNDKITEQLNDESAQVLPTPRRLLTRLLSTVVKRLNTMVRPKPEPWEDTNVSSDKSLSLNDDHLSDAEKLDRWKLYKQTPAYLRDLVWLNSQGKGV